MHEETSGADGRTRTGDLLFTKQLLYQLSYVGDVDLYRAARFNGCGVHP